MIVTPWLILSGDGMGAAMADANILIVLTLPETIRNIYRDRLAAAFPHVHIDLVDHNSKAIGYADKADVLMAFGVMLSDEIFARGKNIRWVQAFGSGVDGITDQPSFRKEIIVTNMRGVHGAPCAESALSSMLALARSLPRVIANQQAGKWERFPSRLLDGKSAVMLGVGVIAEALAPRCKAMGMKTIGVTSTPRDIPGFDEVLPRARMQDAIAFADYLVLLTPYTKENHHLIGAPQLAAMKDSAFLINIARGGVVDEQALIAALQSRQIAGAALDVFATEPLPGGHPLWTLDNVLITPHLAGFHDEYPQMVLPAVEHNLRKFLAGEFAGMQNIVPAAKG